MKLRWEILENWLYERAINGVTPHFTSHEVADGLDIDTLTATRYIQAYLSAQRSTKSDTLFVLSRSGRTKTAIWHAGVRTSDARGTSHQFFDDVVTRFHRALEPDLKRIAVLNPRAGRKCERIVTMVGENAMALLLLAVDGFGDDNE